MHPPFRSFAGCFSVALPGIYLYSGQIHAGYATSFHHEKEIFGPPFLFPLIHPLQQNAARAPLYH